MPWLPQWLPAHLDEHLGWLIVLAAAIGLAACLIGAGLLIRRRAGDAYRPRRALAAVAVCAAGLWMPLFAVMRVQYPAIPLGNQLGVTLLAVAAALASAWLALALALTGASTRAPHRPGGSDRLGGDRPGGDRLGDVVSQALSAAWQGSRRDGVAAAALLALAICAIDVVVLQGALSGIAPVALRPATLAASAPVAVVARPPAPNTLVPGMLIPGMLIPGPPVAGRAGAASGTAPSATQSAAKQSAPDIAALVTEIATAQKIDPLLVLAIIATESAFRADAISPGNAQGLMQLMPETARRFGARNLLDPAENIAAGTRYLRWLLAYFEGDLSLALAGYNAGEGAVLRHGGIPPYPETHLYLQRIRLLYPAERHPFDQLALR